MVIHVVLVVMSFTPFLLSFITYISRKRHAIPNILLCGLALLSISSVILFAVVSVIEFPFMNDYFLNKFILDFLSLAVAVGSLRFLYFTFTHETEDVIDLKYPSRLQVLGRKIKVGKIVYKERKKYRFHLSLEDLEKHSLYAAQQGWEKAILSNTSYFSLKSTMIFHSCWSNSNGNIIFYRSILKD